MHLPGHDALARIRGQIHSCHQQFSVQHIRLEQHAYLPADKPSIYALYGRLEISREISELHHLGTVQQFPPLNVCDTSFP